MAMIPQTSFASGELAPTLWGQFGSDVYKSGLRGCRNFFISPHGAAVSRPGSVFVAAVENFFGGDLPGILVPFKYAQDVAFALYFVNAGNGCQLYVVRDSQLVHQMSAPYVGSTDFRKLKTAQVGAVLYITHPDTGPQMLTYGGTDTSWTFADLTFDPVDTRFASPALVLPPPRGADNLREWHWKITQIIKYPSGLIVETFPLDLTEQFDGTSFTIPPDTDPLATNFYELKAGHVVGVNSATQGDQAEIDFSLFGFISDPGYEILSWRIYRGRGKLFGLVGEMPWNTDANANRFLDFGEDPDFTFTPPEGTDPFKVYDYTGTTLLRVENPQSVTFFDGRLTFGGTPQRPYTIWCSAVENYLDFDQRFLPVPDASIELTLSTRTWQEIRGLVPLNTLLVFTDAAVWAVAGASNGPLAGDDLIQARVQSEVGCSWRDPLVLGNSVLYVAAKGGNVHDLAFDVNVNAFTGGDLSFHARHLFGQEIVSWTYARQPWNIVWAAREDGTALTCQYTGKTAGWSSHTTQGTYEAFCTVPEGDEDVVYQVVRRNINGEIKRFIERQATRVIDDVADCICVDAAGPTYDAGPATTIGGFSHLAGMQVVGVADGFSVGPLTVDALGHVTLPSPASKVTLGLSYTPEIELLDLPAGRNLEKIITRGFIDVEASRGLEFGEDFDHLSRWQSRQVVDGTGATPLVSDAIEVRTQAGWNRGARAVLRQPDPTPVTVTGFSRDVEGGNR